MKSVSGSRLLLRERDDAAAAALRGVLMERARQLGLLAAWVWLEALLVLLDLGSWTEDLLLVRAARAGEYGTDWFRSERRSGGGGE
jgi:hypothetical protein